MIKTYGLTHIALAVEDINRSIAFYKAVFGARKMYNSDGFAQVQTPGSHDIIVFEPYVFFYDPDGYEIEIWYEQLPPGKSFA